MNEIKMKVHYNLSSQFTQTAQSISDKIGIPAGRVASHLSNLRDAGLAECKVNPDSDAKGTLIWKQHPEDAPLRPPQQPFLKRRTRNEMRELRESKRPSKPTSDISLSKIDTIIDRIMDDMVLLRDEVKNQCSANEKLEQIKRIADLVG